MLAVATPAPGLRWVGAERTLRTLPGRRDSPHRCVANARHSHQPHVYLHIAEIKPNLTLTSVSGRK